ncbi:MAG: AAA family ATPase [Saprospiraceae bacterium]|nr:AAA family ATPase [Saprospiraceae bacterium]
MNSIENHKDHPNPATFVQAMDELLADPEMAQGRKVLRAFDLLIGMLDIFIEQDTLRFTTLFAKIAWVSTHIQLPSRWTFLLQSYRRAVERDLIEEDHEVFFLDCGRVLVQILANWHPGTKGITDELSGEAQAFFFKKSDDVLSFKKTMDGLMLSLDEEQKTFVFLEDRDTEKQLVVRFDLADRNELFTNNLLNCTRFLPLPISLVMHDVEVYTDGSLAPAGFVINPDYLVDVTSIASSVSDHAGEHWLYALQKLSQKESTAAILVGNLANAILDIIVNEPETEFDAIIQQFFKLDPLQWSLQTDTEVRDNVQKLRNHFDNIRNVVSTELNKQGISPSHIYLEPSFYCRDYGMQGRLDLFHQHEEKLQADIVELKSSKPFMPNAYGLTESHYLQTLLYELIIQSTYKKQYRTKNYILYSALAQDTLRYAPFVPAKQYELMKARNEIMLIDHALASSSSMSGKITSFLKQHNFKDLKGFAATDLKKFEDALAALDDIERTYYHHFLSFISREQILAKVGAYGPNSTNGLASLWLERPEEKVERFAILNCLEITVNRSTETTPTLELSMTAQSARLSYFRRGDVVVLYPHSSDIRQVLHHQVFKCSIIGLDADHVILRLRSPQKNQHIFANTKLWNLEQDVLDGSFRHMYKNMAMFIGAPLEKRRLLLGRSRPEIYKEQPLSRLSDDLTPEQKNIISKIYGCKDYFLLWGPPGTGKTSMVIKHATRLLYETTDERILLLAYTNRAVDEINEALVEEGLGDKLTRIGSSFAIHPKYTPYLLNEQIAGMATRKEMVHHLKGTRIFISTVSSFMGKLPLMDLISFDTVIIDEASQILEPMLNGLLTRFKRFILIGDHKQLPAVVTQTHAESRVADGELNALGFTDKRTSLFERLYHQCRTNDWFHSWAILSHQGRMHQEIMQFVNLHFYENKLKAIPTLDRLSATYFLKGNNPLQDLLGRHRMLYFPTPTGKKYQFKTNEDEAELVVTIIRELVAMFQNAGKRITEETIGIITPYRAQIALIRSKLGNEHPIQIDTVERFQGGAKDIIILSLVTNRLSQLQTLVSASVEGVDRKLNVALTRAREQLIVIGNREILETNPTYRSLLEASKEIRDQGQGTRSERTVSP